MPHAGAKAKDARGSTPSRRHTVTAPYLPASLPLAAMDPPSGDQATASKPLVVFRATVAAEARPYTSTPASTLATAT
eukprot:gene1338-biopygen8808